MLKECLQGQRGTPHFEDLTGLAYLAVLHDSGFKLAKELRLICRTLLSPNLNSNGVQLEVLFLKFSKPCIVVLTQSQKI